MKHFSEYTQSEIIQDSIREYILWPLGPSGTLTNALGPKYKVDDDSKLSQIEFERLVKYVESYFQAKSTIIQWYIAAIIGILANIFVTLLFTNSIALNNIRISIIILLFIIYVTNIGHNYMPKYTIRYIINPQNYLQFPKNYESTIDIQKIKNMGMKIDISMGFLDDIVTKYSIFIRCCLIKDAILNILKELKYIKIDEINIRTEHFPIYDIKFSTNLYALLKKRNEDDIMREFMAINGAVLDARMNCGVMSLELDKQQWVNNGVYFINEISHLNLDNYSNELINEIKEYNKETVFKHLYKNITNQIIKMNRADLFFYIIILLLLSIILLI